MKLLITLLLSFCLFQDTFCQSFLKDTAAKPFILVDTFPTCNKCLIINYDKIKSINVLKGNNATSLFGEKAKEGAIIISLKEHAKLVRLKEIFDTFNFPDSDRNYRVCINEILVDKPELILADMDEISSIGTFYSVELKCCIDLKDEKLINITSKKKSN